MPSEFQIKDSGEREKFESGAQRDKIKGKGRYDLISLILLERLAKWSELGIEKYECHNWRKGIPLTSYLSSASHHLGCLCEGLGDEDHAAAVVWNMQGFMWTLNEIQHKRLPANLADDCLYAQEKL